jgi:hypothetical protein
MKGCMTKQLVRITGRNGVIYEEWMTEGQLTQFLRLTETRMSLGVAFDEWEISITEVSEQTPGEQEQEREEVIFLVHRNQKE